MDRQSIRAAVLGFLAAVAVSSSALACTFHGFVVQPTLVDRLLPSTQIILARPDPDDRFRFVAVEALAGDLKRVDIPFLVDSMTRRRLAENSGDTVLFSRNGLHDQWRREALISARHRPLLDAIIDRLPAWKAGDDYDRARLFAPYIADRDRTIQELSLREIDRLPYASLRNLGLSPDVDELLSRIDILSEIHLVPIRALLLGLSRDPRARAYIERGFASRTDGDGKTLGPFATALIEIRGVDAVLELTAILSDPDVPVTTRDPIIEALAIHAESGPSGVRQAIDSVVLASIETAPELAGSIARHFGNRSNWTHAQALSDLMTRGELKSSDDFSLVSKYLSLKTRNNSKITSIFRRK